MEYRGFKGRYHVLHGLLSPRDGIGPDQLWISELMERVRREHITELIVLTGFGMQGYATAMFIKDQLKYRNQSNVKLSRTYNPNPPAYKHRFSKN